MQPFKVALCQVQAFGVEEAETNLDNILRALDEAGAAGAQLVALPECAYPAYYLGGDDVYTRPGVRSFDEVAALFGEKARRYGYWLAAGMAMPRPGGGANQQWRRVRPGWHDAGPLRQAIPLAFR
jgi:predicted amidohydrolase